MNHSPLDDSVQFIKGVGPERAKLLKRLGISTIRDLLYHFPRKYLDRTKIETIAGVLTPNPEQETPNLSVEHTIEGKIAAVSLRPAWGGTPLSLRRTRRWQTILEVAIADATGLIRATWFNQPYLKEYFHKGDRLLLSGKLKYYKGYQLESPEYEIIETPGEPALPPGLVPCYPLTNGLTQRYLRKIISTALDKYEKYLLTDLMPGSSAFSLIPVRTAVRQLHSPDTEAILTAARRTIAYQELYEIQLALAERYKKTKGVKVTYPLKVSAIIDEHIRRRIPFTLTPAQERVIAEIKRDLVSPSPMQRLLQGDVGSGKTIVALYAMLAAVGNKTQVALMAPTEILAQQHYQTISRLLKDSRVRIALLTSGIASQERRTLHEQIKQGEIDIVIGTHALIQKNVTFNKLALLIIDEQHKFGVVQRETLRKKGANPHMLIMTATPIPQTLAFTLFGDLGLSVIDQLPPGRRPITTILRPSSKIPQAFDFIRQKITEGRQGYFVYPLIDKQRAKSEEQRENKTILRSATQMAKYLKEVVFPEDKVKLLHGKMKDKKKDAIMQEFREGKINILVSTVVIEVGIDVPNASVMVIDHAERYGLSQLHQLRGRIGRGEHLSYCLLFGDFKTPEAEKRLRIMEETQDGFRIAEEDLRIRGPGEFLGTRQSGLPEFKVADLSRDLDLLKHARKIVFGKLLLC